MNVDFDEEGGGGMQAQRGNEPLFYVNVKIEDSKPIPEEEIVEVPLDDFVMAPRGTSEIKDFDLLTHIEIEPEAEEEEDEDYGEEKEVVHV